MSKKKGYVRYLISVLFLFTLLPVQNSFAVEEEKLISVLQEMEWGYSNQQVLDFFKDNIYSDFKELTNDINDPVKIDRIRKSKNIEFERIKNSFIKFEGAKKTGLEVSIISDEYGKNNGESVLVIKDSVAQKYYFFGDNMLYKIAIAYNSSYIKGIGFEAFVNQVSKKYDRPDETVFDDYGEEMLQAIWTGEETGLRVENKSEFFGTYLMVFYDLEANERLIKLRASFGDKNKGVISVNQDILDAVEEDPFDVEEDVVDEILGMKTEVDLEEAMPQEERIRRIGDSDQSGDVDSIDGLPEEKKKKKKKVVTKKKKNKLKVEEEEKDEDIIIY